MPRYANMPERDDRGRFISDDDTDHLIWKWKPTGRRAAGEGAGQ